ncbi:MAG: diacylglycerol kinase family protein [Leifsonia flava]
MSSPEHRTRRAAVIVNPTKVDPAALRAVVARHSDWHGWADPLWLETTVEDPGGVVAARAVEAGVTVVLAAGGDGTVRAVASALRGTGIPLTLVPSGTGNLLARNLELPLGDLEYSVRLAFEGTERPMDVGITSVVTVDGASEDHAFVVMAGLGLDADMIATANPALKKKVGWLAYVDSGMRALPKAKRFRLRYAMGDEEHRHHAHISTVLIGNCGTLPGNILLFPEARIDDGILDIAMMQPRTLFGWLDVWRRVAWENRVMRPFAFGRRIIKLTDAAAPATMTTMRGPRIVMQLEEPRFFELDGDEIAVIRSMTAWVEDDALIVMVPPLV